MICGTYQGLGAFDGRQLPARQGCFTAFPIGSRSGLLRGTGDLFASRASRASCGCREQSGLLDFRAALYLRGGNSLSRL